MERKVNLENVRIRTLYKFFSGKMEFKDAIDLLEEAVEGGVMDLPVTELASLMSSLVYELQRNSEIVAIAIASMKNHLKGDD